MKRHVKRIIIASLLLFAVVGPAIYPASAQAQSQINVSNSTVQGNYPNSLTFSCQVQDNTNITDIRLDYQVKQMSFADVTSEAEATFSQSTSVNATYTLNMEQYGQIPQGVVLDYWWTVKDAAGNKGETTPSQYTVIDNKHTWSTLTQGYINVHWYGQNQSFGQAIMNEAQTALSTINNDTGGKLDESVNISVYTSIRDYAASVLGVQEWSGGVTLSQYNSILVVIEPDALSSDLPAAAHELTHAVIGQLTFNPYNSIPFWLNEGLAVHVQFTGGQLPSYFTSTLSNGIANNNLISVRSLSDPFSAFADKAYLSYAESDSVVTYLINQYGSDKMHQLLNSFKQGSTYDDALQSIYGFNMDGLFNQWKAWVTNGNQPIY